MQPIRNRCHLAFLGCLWLDEALFVSGYFLVDIVEKQLESELELEAEQKAMYVKPEVTVFLKPDDIQGGDTNVPESNNGILS